VLEAFAGHFLTDSFSAGHQKTERASIQEYWDAKMPDFAEKFQQWLADAVNLETRMHPASIETRIGRQLTPQYVTEKVVMPKVHAAMDKLPKVGFGDLVSGAVHDYFNLHGVQAQVGGDRLELVGDKRMLTKDTSKSQPYLLRHVTTRSQKATFDAAAAAVRAGIAEVHRAYELGQQGEDPQIAPQKILNENKGIISAEALIPDVVPDKDVYSATQKTINWQVGTYQALLIDPRIAEGLAIALDHYADLVGDSLSGLNEEEMKAVKTVLIARMKGGEKEVRRLIDEIIRHKPLEGGGFDRALLDDLNDIVRSTRGPGR
jgi:hypothetical protein